MPMDLSQHLKLYPFPWQDDHVRTQQMGALAINVSSHLDIVLIENPQIRACKNLERSFCSGSLHVRAMSPLFLAKYLAKNALGCCRD